MIKNKAILTYGVRYGPHLPDSLREMLFVVDYMDDLFVALEGYDCGTLSTKEYNEISSAIPLELVIYKRFGEYEYIISLKGTTRFGPQTILTSEWVVDQFLLERAHEFANKHELDWDNPEWLLEAIYEE